jgi:uncharacterized protein YkwD
LPALAVGLSNEERCLVLVNNFRQSQGKNSLAYSQKLTDMVMPHSMAMLQGKVPFGHAGFDTRFAQGVRRGSAAENVAMVDGVSDPVKSIVDQWIGSPGHRKNMLGDYREMGVAFARRNNLWYATQFFA